MKSTYLIFLVGLVLTGCKKELMGDLLIQNVNVINVENGEVETAQDVLIISDSIANIEANGQFKYIASVTVDGTDKFLIPGLWDMHTHDIWRYKYFIPLLMANGITGIRQMKGLQSDVREVREAIAKGKIIGPEIITAGNIVDGKPGRWPSHEEVATPEEGRAIVRKQQAEGADFIKVYSFLDRETYMAIADECRRLGIPFSGHIPHSVTLKEAIDAGQYSAEHFIGTLEYCSDSLEYYYRATRKELDDPSLKTYTNKMEFVVNTFNEQRIDSLLKLVKGSNIWMCPTNVVNHAYSEQRPYDTVNYEDKKYYMPEDVIARWHEPLPEEEVIKMHVWKDHLRLSLSVMKPMRDAGVGFLAGTDYPLDYCLPGFSLHNELEIFVEKAGFTPLEALQTATLNPALFLKKEKRFGTVEKGKIANLVLLSANPLERIGNTRKIDATIVRGEYLRGDSLRASLQEIARLNKLPKIGDPILEIANTEGIGQAIARYHYLRKNQPDAYNFDEEQLIALGYQILDAGRTEDAIKIFELNTHEFPDHANGFDSLGDAYVFAKDTVRATAAYKKALDLGMFLSEDKLKKLINSQ